MESTTFIISLVAVIIATASTVISYLLFRDAKDPYITIYASPDKRRPSIINLIIENTGRTPAWDVKFESESKIPKEAFGIDLASAKTAQPMDNGPIVNGIPCFGPGSQRVITWGQYGGLLTSIGEGFLDIEAIYYSRPNLAFWPRKHSTLSRIDIKSFENSDVSDDNWDKKIAEELKKISAVLSSSQSKPENALKIISVERAAKKHN